MLNVQLNFAPSKRCCFWVLPPEVSWGLLENSPKQTVNCLFLIVLYIVYKSLQSRTWVKQMCVTVYWGFTVSLSCLNGQNAGLTALFLEFSLTLLHKKVAVLQSVVLGRQQHQQGFRLQPLPTGVRYLLRAPCVWRGRYKSALLHKRSCLYAAALKRSASSVLVGSPNRLRKSFPAVKSGLPFLALWDAFSTSSMKVCLRRTEQKISW